MNGAAVWRNLVGQIVAPAAPAAVPTHAALRDKTEYEHLRASMRSIYQRNKVLRQKMTGMERGSVKHQRARARLLLNNARLEELKQKSAALRASGEA